MNVKRTVPFSIGVFVVVLVYTLIIFQGFVFIIHDYYSRTRQLFQSKILTPGKKNASMRLDGTAEFVTNAPRFY